MTVQRRDDGMTVVEIIIVTSLIGLVALVLAVAATTILRITPQTSFRIDDARSTRGLQTWLVRDVASAPQREISLTEPTGYLFAGGSSAAAGVTLCGGSDATLVLHMTWSEQSAIYHATYHLENGRVVRDLCGSHSGSVRLTSGVSTTQCALQNYAIPVIFTPPPPDPSVITSVEICLVGLEADTGLNAGGGTTQEITLSVSSRNPQL